MMKNLPSLVRQGLCRAIFIFKPVQISPVVRSTGDNILCTWVKNSSLSLQGHHNFILYIYFN